MTRNLKLLTNFVEKCFGTVRFGNDQFTPILGYEDLVQGNVTIKRVYYIEGLNHNLFSVSQFCDADLEVAFRKSTCFVRDLQGNDLLTDSHGYDLYTIELQDSSYPTPICFMAKASSNGENLDKMKEKGDACNFVGYATQSKGFGDSSSLAPQRLTTTSKQNSLGPTPQCHKTREQQRHEPSSSTHVQNTLPSTATKDNQSMLKLELLFSPMFYEYLNRENEVVPKSSAISDKRNTTQSTPTPVTSESPQLIVHSTPDLTTPTT
ncbi:hypothetical protein Tco_0827650 [Tanacetum coccineum]